ncbi:hypothetical protein HKD37_15G043896 [Glycine soja]
MKRQSSSLACRGNLGPLPLFEDFNENYKQLGLNPELGLGNPSDLQPFDPEIDRTFHRLVRQHLVPFEHPEHSVISDFEHYSFEHSDFEHSKNMAQPPPRERTLREMAAPNFTYESLCIQYPDEDVPYVLKTGLIHLLPKFHGLAAETKKLEGKLDALVNLVTQLAMNQKFAPVARLCGLCSSTDHHTDLCPSLEDQAQLSLSLPETIKFIGMQRQLWSSASFRRLQCLSTKTIKMKMCSKGDNVFIYISKTTTSSVIYAFKMRQCLHLYFEDDNVFSHLRFQKATMSSFTFRRRQYLQSFMLSKGNNPFIYVFEDDNVFISKTSMSFVLVCASRDSTSFVSMFL